MKKNLFILALVTVLSVLFTACKKDPSSEPQPDPQPAETLNGNQARPAWNATEDYDFTSSMTAVIRVDLAKQYADLAKDFVLQENDLVSAFIGNTCVGTASPNEGLFYLYIAGPSDQQSTMNVTLRYWSSFYKNIFIAKDAFPFVNDTKKGTVANPYAPVFVVESK